MAKLKVALIALGDGLPIDLTTLARKLNRCQRSFLFESPGSIPTDELGDPQIDNKWYDVNKLFEILRARGGRRHHLFVGVTHVDFTSPGSDGKSDGHYFSFSDKEALTVICVSEEMLEYNSPRKDTYQYAAYLVMGELLINMTRTDLMHTRPDNCLFDECENRKTFRYGIDKGYICPTCEMKLGNLKVDDAVVEDVKKVLSWCKRDRTGAVLAHMIYHPIPMLIVGAYVGWVTQSFIQRDYWLHVTITSLMLFGLACFFVRLRFSAR